MITTLRPIAPGTNIGSDAVFVIERVGGILSFQCIDETTPDGDVSYVGLTFDDSGAHFGRVYDFENLPNGFHDKIQSVTIVVIIREATPGPKANLNFFSIQNGILNQGDDIDFRGISEYTEYRLQMPLATDSESNPVPWTKDYVNQSEYGYVLSGDSNEIRITYCAVEVEHVGCSREVELVEPIAVTSDEPVLSVRPAADPASTSTPEFAVASAEPSRAVSLAPEPSVAMAEPLMVVEECR